jgi:phosphatidylinositol alpha-1,6-mannosyltransferase
MRILHITPDYYPAMGGAEVYIREISERLARRGHDVTVLTMDSQRSWRVCPVDRELINQVKVKPFARAYKLHERFHRIRGTHRLLSLAASPAHLRMLSVSPYSLRAFNFTLRSQADVVAVINWYHGSLAYQTCLARRIRNFALVGIPLFHTDWPWSHSALYPTMLGRCDAVVAMTEHEKNFIERCSTQTNAHVVGAGVDPSAFAHADGNQRRARHGIGDAPLVGYVGRMVAYKGVVTLIDAMKTVWRTDPRVRLLLAGSGLPPNSNCEDRIAQAFERLSTAERSRIIEIDGFSDGEKASLFAALDLFVMPSTAEAFGIGYLEAWICQKAVIGSRIGSTECVIDDGVDGVLVTPGNPDDLARSILRLLADHVTRERMGQAGQTKTLTRFTWDAITDEV